MEWSDTEAECCLDDCATGGETIIECVACNYAYHDKCHDFKYGVKSDGSRGAWCTECFNQIKPEMLTFKTMVANCSFVYTVPERPEAPVGAPPKKKLKTVKGVLRSIKTMRPLESCSCTKATAHNWQSGMCCNMFSDEQRNAIRSRFLARRQDPKPGALERALELPHAGIRKTVVYTKKNMVAGQTCTHCKHLDKEDQNPAANHTVVGCEHNNGKTERKGGSIKTDYVLYDTNVGADRPVHVDFFRNTYGLSKDRLAKLKAVTTTAGMYKKEENKENKKTRIIHQFLLQVPRHYSHYSPESTVEYVDCASSCMKLWCGPTQGDEDDDRCFLEWFDGLSKDELEAAGFKEADQGSFKYYTAKKQWPGIHNERPKATLPLDAPKLPISFQQFHRVTSTYDMKYKDLTPDQCVTCNTLTSEMANGTEEEKAAANSKLKLHQQMANMTYKLRAKMRDVSAAGWKVSPPTANPEPQSNANYDFVQADYGGGLRTPWVFSGPAYFLRTLPSKPYYMASSTGKIYTNWSNCTISEAGGDEISSIAYRYVTEHPTGAKSIVFSVDGTYGQANNTTFFMFCMDLCNPESKTYVAEDGKALYCSVDIMRGPVGHTYMLPDAIHSSVTRTGKATGQVASTEEWAKVASEVSYEGKPLCSELAEQPHFLQWGAYLKQTYVARKQDVLGRTLRFHQDYRFVNFGYGRLPDEGGNPVWRHHPYELWLRKGDDPTKPLHQEAPVRVCYGRHLKPDGRAHAQGETFSEWYERIEANAGRELAQLPLHEFVSYENPLPITVEKQWDLYKLSTHLKRSPTLSDAQIKELYPQPDGDDPAVAEQSEEEEEEEESDEEDEE
jgi:hypothetical protein